MTSTIRFDSSSRTTPTAAVWLDPLLRNLDLISCACSGDEVDAVAIPIIPIIQLIMCYRLDPVFYSPWSNGVSSILLTFRMQLIVRIRRTSTDGYVAKFSWLHACNVVCRISLQEKADQQMLVPPDLGNPDLKCFSIPDQLRMVILV